MIFVILYLLLGVLSILGSIHYKMMPVPKPNEYFAVFIVSLVWPIFVASMLLEPNKYGFEDDK